MKQYDLTIMDVLGIRKALADNPHMRTACDRLLELCGDWGHNARIGTMTLGNDEGLASLHISFRLPFSEGDDLAPDMTDIFEGDEHERYDCIVMRAKLASVPGTGVTELTPLRKIYDFWRRNSESVCAGWLINSDETPESLAAAYSYYGSED